jgi:hypothetical protein
MEEDHWDRFFLHWQCDRSSLLTSCSKERYLLLLQLSAAIEPARHTGSEAQARSRHAARDGRITSHPVGAPAPAP